MLHNEKPSPGGLGLFSFITLGCKSNQYDSAAMASQLVKAGLSDGSIEEAHVIVVNTCIVTGPTEAQCRKAIRQARKTNAKAKLVVSGCMSTGTREQLEAMREVDLIIEPSQKGQLPALLGIRTSHDWTDWPDDPAVSIGARDRGFLKIQDGCNAACTYCIVPLVRGRSRSLKPARAVAAIRELMNRGLSEVVLTGIHLGQYGFDLAPVCTLEDLLDIYFKEMMPGRIRLSSIEPLEITPRLVDILAGAGGRICRHIHIPMQSGSDRILKIMRRPYTREHFIEAVKALTGSVPGIGIGCDIICGFPGESEKDFELTMDLIEKLKIPFIHAFPYSPRPGTSASSLADNVPHAVKKERVSLLIDLARTNREHFAGTLIGGYLKAAIESRKGPDESQMGLSDNYLRIAVKSDSFTLIPGDIVEVEIDRREGDLLLGHLKEDP